jgi:TolB-like protein/Tfp pilus assembly protein PilF
MQVFMLALAVGFPIALIFAWAFEITPEGVKLEKDVDRSKSITHKTAQKMNRHIIIALSIAVVFLLVDRFMPGKDPEPQPVVDKVENTGTATMEAELEQTEKSIAVLPFVNMSSDPEQDYFADGISEEILNALAGVSELKVAGRTSSFAFKGKNEDLLAIGKVLRVNHILEGSVRKSGNRVRITAQLIKVDDGFHMWSETFDRELDDIFVIQDEISAAILTQMKTQLLGEQQPLTASTDPRAYELYLLAKQRIYDRNKASLEMAEKLLIEATTIDPTYAPAFAQLGISYILNADDAYGSMPFAEAKEKSKLHLDKALQLDPENAEALSGMGLFVYSYELDHQKAIDLLQRAVAINPNMADANTWLANQLDMIGNIQAGFELRKQTFERDPLHAPTFGNLQQAYTILGQPEQALKMLDGLQAYLPDDAKLMGDFGQVNLMRGHLGEAQKYFQASFEKEPLNVVNRIWYGFNLLNSRQYESAARVAPDQLATLALSRLGRTEEALIMGKNAIDEGQNPTWYFQALVENGRYAELISVLESRWPGLDEFSRDWPGRRGYGYRAMGHIAQAYREVGNDLKFNEAMSRLRDALDSQLAEGADNWPLRVSQAQYAMLVDDHDAAIAFLEMAFEQGFYLDTTYKTGLPIFKPLNGNPRYETAKAAMVARLDEELKKMESESLESRQTSLPTELSE